MNPLAKPDRKLVLRDGREFHGFAHGSGRDAVCELVFNTSMVGYQEILSDPSYTAQTVVMTYPLIGNYGINAEDFETKDPSIGGMVVGEVCDIPSNFRTTRTFAEAMQDYDIPILSGVDTRMITRIIRDEGSQVAAMVAEEMPTAEAVRLIEETPTPHDQVSRVSCRKRWFSRTPGHKYDVVAIDCGMKLNIVRSLSERGCNMVVLPYNATAEAIMSYRPDGLFISNGPGNPEDVPTAIDAIRELRGKLPIFGICLGQQMIGLAYGAKTYKLKFGHRGGNHPVRCLETGKVEMTSQNHSYAIDEKSLFGTPLKVSHINLLDGTVEGLECREDRVFSVQYHPESAPGPQDSCGLFDKFINMMEESKNA